MFLYTSKKSPSFWPWLWAWKDTTNKTTRCLSINAPVILRLHEICHAQDSPFYAYMSIISPCKRLDQNHHFDNALQGRQDTQEALFALVNFHSPNHIADTRRSWALYLAWNGTCCWWEVVQVFGALIWSKGLGERQAVKDLHTNWNGESWMILVPLD